MRRPLALSDRTFAGKNGMSKGFWYFINSNYPQSFLSREHLKGREYDEFIAELIKRRDAVKDAKTPGALRKAQKAYEEYRNLSVELNFRFIMKQAGHYASKVSPNKYHDLMQECVMGWMRGLDTFDPDKSRITTHAAYWIMQGVRRFVFHDHVVHVPIYLWEQGVRLPDAFSLDAPKEVNVKWDSNWKSPQSFQGFLPDGEAPTPDDNAYQMELSNVAHSLLEGLEPRERDIIIRRFGMNGSGPEGETLHAIAKDYGLTRERVRQIEQKALNRIRDGVKRGKIKPSARNPFTLRVIQGGGE